MDLSYNPLSCDCSATWLLAALAGRNSSRATCAAPAGLAGRQLGSLQPGDLQCGAAARQQRLLAALCVAAGLLTARSQQTI